VVWAFKALQNKLTLKLKILNRTFIRMNNGPVLVAQQVSKQVQSGENTLSILNDINLTINAGESLSIVGTSGAGKSTLLALMAGLDLPSSGRLQLLGKDLATLSEDQRAELRAGKVGFVFQSFQLLAGFTALENVMLPLELAGDPRAKELAMATLEQVGLADRAGHRPPQLSGGEQQRVAVARAFAMRPKILFADEPTGNLDDKTSGKIVELLFELNTQLKTTLILVTHDRELAANTQRLVTLADGKLYE
jgi:putative ABC transport system ATP-binding protein